MSTIKQLQWRYATKKFDATKTLSKEKIDVLKQAFNLTATSFGLQTLKLLILENKEQRVPLLQHSYNQKQVVDASHLLVICIQDNIEVNDINEYYKNIKAIRNTPDSILNPYKNDLIEMMDRKTIEERQQWSKNQAYIALGNLMTVCAIEGIDACPMEGFNPEAYNNHLNLSELGLESVLLLPVGYRADNDMFATLKKVRKPLTETVIEL
ncbi:NAD(P)H-dependent oxidoreductase [Postechiella marina]|uniref:NAD(P)H-dependent oxidoreductase n=1 Tax=Postechiella marina TaxID=943941 RepID=A0ABP8BYL6_9FLAO